jgi:hypothetical protein
VGERKGKEVEKKLSFSLREGKEVEKKEGK